MKIIILLCVLLINNVCADNQSIIDLNSQNLELLALKQSPESVIEKYVLNLIKTEYPKEYYPIIKDKEKVAALVEKHTKEVLLAASKLSSTTNFKMGKNVNYIKFDENTSKINIKNFILGNAFPVSKVKLRDDGLPSNFILLIPNLEMLNNFKVDSNKFKALMEARNNTRNKGLYLEMIVNLVKFQNDDNFQTVIKEVKIYDSQSKNVELSNKTEKKKSNDVIENWLLSDGYTNKLIGIHAFSFFGYRLQDQMRTVSSAQNYCNKTKKIGKHQVVVCTKPFRDSAFIIGTYIGGIVAKVDLVAKSALSTNDKKRIMQELKIYLNQPQSIINKTHHHWTMHNVDFDFYSDAFNGVKSKESKYSDSFGKNKQLGDQDLTVVVSMISHETKKLIEDNK